MQIATFIQHFESSIDGIAPGSISPQTEFQKIPQWDSLALLMCVSMIGSDYHVQVAGREVNGCTTIEELYNLVQSKKTAG